MIVIDVMSEQIEDYMVIHHFPCPDGELSAAIFKKEKSNDNLNIEFIPWLHEKKDELVIEIIEKLKLKKYIVYFLDYCPSFELLEGMNEFVEYIKILDHHEAACLELKEILNDKPLSKVEMIFNNKKSGCQLTWEYFNPDKEYPLAVKHIGNKDIWNWEDKDTEPFTNEYPVYFSLKSELTPEERLDIYLQVLDCPLDKFSRIVEKGIVNIGKMRNECLKLLPLAEFTVDTDNNGKELSVVDIPMKKYHLTKYITELVEKEHPEYQVLRLKYDKPGKIVYSLRSLKKEIRVDLLAQKYGGNGHAAASGYNLNI